MPNSLQPHGHSLPGSSVHGLLHAGILEWVAMLSFRRFSNRGIKPASLMFPALAGGFFTTSTTWEAPIIYYSCQKERLIRENTNHEDCSWSTWEMHLLTEKVGNSESLDHIHFQGLVPNTCKQLEEYFSLWRKEMFTLAMWHNLGGSLPSVQYPVLCPGLQCGGRLLELCNAPRVCCCSHWYRIINGVGKGVRRNHVTLCSPF